MWRRGISKNFTQQNKWEPNAALDKSTPPQCRSNAQAGRQVDRICSPQLAAAGSHVIHVTHSTSNRYILCVHLTFPCNSFLKASSAECHSSYQSPITRHLVPGDISQNLGPLPLTIYSTVAPTPPPPPPGIGTYATRKALFSHQLYNITPQIYLKF